MSRNFLIESPVADYAWKLTGNSKEICGIKCMEATFEKDSTLTAAWFAPSIPVSVGPALYGGLPGIIMEININNGKRVISAVSVKDEDPSDLIRKPTKGKKVTREEFSEIVKEKTGQQNQEGGGVFMIKITN
jgi:GLPGLI family protein